MERIRSILTLSPLKITGSYLIFGVVWILVSDRLVVSLVETREMITQLQTIKGWVFVGLSGFLIFGLTRLRHEQVRTSQTQLQNATQQLQVLHRVFRHNIRNDLNVIRGYIELVQDYVDREPAGEHLTKAHRTSQQILDVSEKLQVVDTIDPQTRNGELDLVETIHRECDWLKSSYPSVTIEMDLPDTIRVEGDESLGYAIRELLENAVEHYDGPLEQCLVTIAISKSRGEVTTRIIDNGPGIPDDDLESLRTGEETPLVHTSGVGLWLVTWLCRLHDGDVRFDTESEEGTVVELQLQPASTLSRLTVEPLRESPIELGVT